MQEKKLLVSLAVDARGERILVGSVSGLVWLVPLENGETQRLTEDRLGGAVLKTALSRDGRLGAVSVGLFQAVDAAIHVWDLDNGESRSLSLGDGKQVDDLLFTPDDRLLSASEGGLRMWNLQDGTSRLLLSQPVLDLDYKRDGRYLIASVWNQVGEDRQSEAILFDLQEERIRKLDSHLGARYGLLSGMGDTSQVVTVTTRAAGRSTLGLQYVESRKCLPSIPVPAQLP